MSCSASRNNNNNNNPSTTLVGCTGGSTTTDHDHDSTTLVGCTGGSTTTTDHDHDSTTLAVCHHNKPSTTLAHSSKEDAIKACANWCGERFAEQCKETDITTTGEAPNLTYHWTIPEGCKIQCPATGASSR